MELRFEKCCFKWQDYNKNKIKLFEFCIKKSVFPGLDVPLGRTTFRTNIIEGLAILINSKMLSPSALIGFRKKNHAKFMVELFCDIQLIFSIK